MFFAMSDLLTIKEAGVPDLKGKQARCQKLEQSNQWKRKLYSSHTDP